MTLPSDPQLLVMHGLRLKGFALPSVVAETVDLSEQDVSSILERLVADSYVTFREGRLSGFTLTPAGRSHHASLLSEELDTHDVRASIQAAYARFLGLNSGLLEVCTAWQLREADGEPVLNDHLDPAYDSGVIDRLASLHGQVHPICEELATHLARYGRYGRDLTTAVARVRNGEVDWFTKPVIASYHTVWFELHEDLLATLGIERGSEVVS